MTKPASAPLAPSRCSRQSLRRRWAAPDKFCTGSARTVQELCSGASRERRRKRWASESSAMVYAKWRRGSEARFTDCYIATTRPKSYLKSRECSVDFSGPLRDPKRPRTARRVGRASLLDSRKLPGDGCGNAVQLNRSKKKHTVSEAHRAKQNPPAHLIKRPCVLEATLPHLVDSALGLLLRLTVGICLHGEDGTSSNANLES